MRAAVCQILLLPAFGFAEVVTAEEGPVRAMVYCHLAAAEIVKSNPQGLPRRPNLAVLLEGTFKQFSGDENTPFEVMATADADQLLGGVPFRSIRLAGEGHYSLQTDGSEEIRFHLVMTNPQDGVYQSGLTNILAGTAPTHLGFCGFAEMEDAEGVFYSNPPQSSSSE